MSRALVIEDNPDNMKLITFLLAAEGYAFLCAATGRHGLELALAERPDFVLLDIQLPDMDGTEVLRALRQDPWGRCVPIIAITSYAMSGDRQRLLAAGCAGYLEKPIDPDHAVGEIRAILEGSRPCAS